MGLFKPKTKETFYETEMSLPSFSIDGNGFIIFDDPSLGGAAVLEVIPNVHTEGMTHEDPLYHNDSTDAFGYEPSLGALFGDERATTYPGWVWFLNQLESHDFADDPCHVQVLIKKCRTPEWDTKIDYAAYMAHKKFDERVSHLDGNYSPREKMYARRALDYTRLLDRLKDEADGLSDAIFDVRKLPSYKVKYYLVVSYTPSSEGWWLDGRDSDYYVTDNSVALSLFAGDRKDKMATRISNTISGFRNRKAPAEAGVAGEDDFFWIESDRIAQIIDTRLNKVFNAIDLWNETNKKMPMPFAVRLLDERETPALVCFFPNILTPYWDRVWELGSDQDDLLYRMEVIRAIDAGDTSIVTDPAYAKGIAAGDISMLHSQEEQEKFLEPYRGRSYNDIKTLSEQRRAAAWSPEKEAAEKALQEAQQRDIDDDIDLFGDFGIELALDEEFKTDAEREQEFLSKYKKFSSGDFSDGIDELDDPKNQLPKA